MSLRGDATLEIILAIVHVDWATRHAGMGGQLLPGGAAPGQLLPTGSAPEWVRQAPEIHRPPGWPTITTG